MGEGHVWYEINDMLKRYCISCISGECGMAAVKPQQSRAILQNCLFHVFRSLFLAILRCGCLFFTCFSLLFPNCELLERRYLHGLADSWQTLQLLFRAVKADQSASKVSGEVRKHVEQPWNHIFPYELRLNYSQRKSCIEQHHNNDKNVTHLDHPSPLNLAESHVFDPKYVALIQRDSRPNCREVRWMWPHTKYTQTGTVGAQNFNTLLNYLHALKCRCCAWLAENALNHGSMQKYRSFWGFFILLRCLVTESWLSSLRSHFCLDFFFRAQLFRQFSAQPFLNRLGQQLSIQTFWNYFPGIRSGSLSQPIAHKSFTLTSWSPKLLHSFHLTDTFR